MPRIRRLGFHVEAGLLAGHLSSTMTDRYTHLGPEDLRAVLDCLQA